MTSEEVPIDHEHFKIGKEVGRGSNNAVYSAIYAPYGAEGNEVPGVVRVDRSYLGDLPPEIAKQREYRGTNGKKGLGARLGPASNVITSVPFIDHDGRDFYFMPGCERTVEEALTREDGSTGSVKEGYIDVNRVINWARGIARGLYEFHVDEKKVHGDLNTENLMIYQDGRVVLIDPDTSERISVLNKDKNPRDNVGVSGIRSFELFREGSIPTTMSDVYSVGAVIGKLFTGRYPLQKRLEMSLDPKREIAEMEPGEASGIIEDYMKDVPGPFRNFLWKCLTYLPESRFKDGKELEKGLNKAIRKYHRSKPKARIIQGAIAATVLGVLGVGGIIGHGIDKDLRAKSGLEKEVEDWKKNSEYAKKRRIVDMSMNNKLEYMHLAEEGKLSGWQWHFSEMLGEEVDPKIAIAAYFNYQATYEAMQRTGGKTFEEIREVLTELDPLAASHINDINHGMHDNFIFHARSTNFGSVKEKWEEAKSTYEAKKAAEEKEEKRKRRERRFLALFQM